VVGPGCTTQGETLNEHSPEAAPAQHRRHGAGSSNPGRYRLFPAAILECVCVTSLAEQALGWLVT